MVSEPLIVSPAPTANGFETKKQQQQLCLEMDCNPTPIFYKDEGGKSNFLTASCTVKFQTSTPPCRTVPIGNLRLCPRLVYESGGEIEDEEEIFNVLNIEPKTITSTNETFTVKFRIEKVSRRKDGKKFRIRFDVNGQSSQLLDYVGTDVLAPVETSAVTVLSKRKSHTLPHGLGSSSAINQKNNKPWKPKSKGRRIPKTKPEEVVRSRLLDVSISDGPSSPLQQQSLLNDPIATNKRPRKGTNQSGNSQTITLPVNFLLKIKENMMQLENRVKALTDRVTYLERQKPAGNIINRGHRVHSLMFEDGNGFKMEDEYTLGGGNGLSHDITASPQTSGGIKRNASSTHELFEFLATSSLLN